MAYKSLVSLKEVLGCLEVYNKNKIFHKLYYNLLNFF